MKNAPSEQTDKAFQTKDFEIAGAGLEPATPAL